MEILYNVRLKLSFCLDSDSNGRGSPLLYICYDGIANPSNPVDLTAVISLRAGVRLKPTPAGIPVAMISPGSNVMSELRNETIIATEKSFVAVRTCCTICPLTLVVKRSAWRLGRSEANTIPGPTGA